jgi:acetolactate synthase-1/2/3 large subunit
MAAPATVAEAFAGALRGFGIERVYGLPCEDHLRLLDALPAAGLRYVGAREESAAALMAATEAQASGLPGVVVVTIAPGITNAINGIAHAWLDEVPLLVVCGQHAPERAPLIVRQRLDNHRLVDSITRWTASASPRIHQVLARALETARAAPCGPVLLELRDDVAAAAPLDTLADWPPLETSYPSTVATVPAEVQQRVSSSRAPVIIVGAACPADDSTCQAIQLASQRLSAPVLCSPAAMGVLGPDHPWLAGTFLNGNLEMELLSRCDLMLTLGLDARDFFNAAWRYTIPVIALNPRADTRRFVPAECQLVGQTAAILEAMSCVGSASTWSTSDIECYRDSVERPFHMDLSDFTIPSALRMARSVLPPETRVAVDAGFGKPLASYLWTAPKPNMYFSAHGLSTMGYALPAANALQLVYPDRPVAAFMGDGSLLMRASELSVAVEHGLSPIYVAWMDGSLSQIETKQLRQHLEPVGARLPRLECARIADAFGANGVDVHSLDDFGRALEAALGSLTPTLIGAHVDQSRRGDWYELLRG